jgi:hypothetical protein
VGSRRVVPVVLAVAGLLAIAALASNGRPLTGSTGTGPTPQFFDYVFTTIALFAIAMAAIFVWSLLGAKWKRPQRHRPAFGLVQFLVTMAASILFGWLLIHAHLHFHLKSPSDKGASGIPKGVVPREPSPLGRRGARLRWDEIAIVAALLAAAGVAAFAGRATKPLKEWRYRTTHEDIALALDESLDDLRNDPDIRRAIIAAYARMERALAVSGLPRRPSEAPDEYLARTLRELDASAPAVTRLTDLFKWAKFSHHEPDAVMRDDAIAALEAVRDELRAPAEAA